MVRPDLTNLSPQDAVVTLRSFPRRYSAEFSSIDGTDLTEELASRIGSSGESALQIVGEVTRTWVLLRESLRQILRHDEVFLHPAITNPALRQWDTQVTESLFDSLNRFIEEAEALAALAETVSPISAWARSGTLAGDGAISALDLRKEWVSVGAVGLSRVRTTMSQVKG